MLVLSIFTTGIVIESKQILTKADSRDYNLPVEVLSCNFTDKELQALEDRNIEFKFIDKIKEDGKMGTCIYDNKTNKTTVIVEDYKDYGELENNNTLIHECFHAVFDRVKENNNLGNLSGKYDSYMAYIQDRNYFYKSDYYYSDHTEFYANAYALYKTNKEECKNNFPNAYKQIEKWYDNNWI